MYFDGARPRQQLVPRGGEVRQRGVRAVGKYYTVMLLNELMTAQSPCREC